MNFLYRVELHKVIWDSGLVPNEDISMHVNAILAGDYTLKDLLSAAPSWYNASYSKVQDSLEDTL